MGYVLVKAAPAVAAAAGAALRAGGALASKIGVKGAVKGAVGVKTLQSLNQQFGNQQVGNQQVGNQESNLTEKDKRYGQLAAETRQMLRDKASTNPTQFS